MPGNSMLCVCSLRSSGYRSVNNTSYFFWYHVVRFAVKADNDSATYSTEWQEQIEGCGNTTVLY